MNTPAIKICGLTSVSQAQRVEELGADLIGMIFASSPRQVDESTAQAITAAVAIPTVGVFVDESPAEIHRLARAGAIRWAQLHGNESPAQLAEIDVPVIKAFRIRDASSIEAVHAFVSACSTPPRAILLDAYHPQAAGGTGETFNWSLLATADRRDWPMTFLAGGIDPDNARDALAATNCDGLDASSRLETRPGVKDMDRVRALIQSVRNG